MSKKERDNFLLSKVVEMCNWHLCKEHNKGKSVCMIRNSSGIQFSIKMWFHPWQQHYINF